MIVRLRISLCHLRWLIRTVDGDCLVRSPRDSRFRTQLKVPPKVVSHSRVCYTVGKVHMGELGDNIISMSKRHASYHVVLYIGVGQLNTSLDDCPTWPTHVYSGSGECGTLECTNNIWHSALGPFREGRIIYERYMPVTVIDALAVSCVIGRLKLGPNYWAMWTTGRPWRMAARFISLIMYYLLSRGWLRLFHSLTHQGYFSVTFFTTQTVTVWRSNISCGSASAAYTSGRVLFDSNSVHV